MFDWKEKKNVADNSSMIGITVMQPSLRKLSKKLKKELPRKKNMKSLERDVLIILMKKTILFRQVQLLIDTNLAGCSMASDVKPSSFSKCLNETSRAISGKLASTLLVSVDQASSSSWLSVCDLARSDLSVVSIVILLHCL